jgi:precorrin-3B C17-methyltransferase
VLYNPKSKKRDWQLGAVREMLLRHKDPATPVGIVSRAMRKGQETVVTTLQDLPNHPVDMQTIVIIGNSQTFAYGSYMITPRGYRDKYGGQVSGVRRKAEIRDQSLGVREEPDC